MLKTFLFLISFQLVLNGCKNISHINTKSIDPYFLQFKREKDVIKAKIGPFNQNSKTFRIMNAKIDANNLFIEIEYKASCQGDDSFDFYSSALYKNEDGMECRDSRLFISGTNKSCSLINETKIIDLLDLTNEVKQGSEVLLNISGYRTKMPYVYVSPIK